MNYSHNYSHINGDELAHRVAAELPEVLCHVDAAGLHPQAAKLREFLTYAQNLIDFNSRLERELKKVGEAVEARQFADARKLLAEVEDWATSTHRDCVGARTLLEFMDDGGAP